MEITRRQSFLFYDLCKSFFLWFSNIEACQSLRQNHDRRESETTEKPISERPQPLPQPHVVGVVALPQSLPSYWTNQDGRSKHKTCRGYQSYYVYCIWFTCIYDYMIYIYVYLYVYMSYIHIFLDIYGLIVTTIHTHTHIYIYIHISWLISTIVNPSLCH